MYIQYLTNNFWQTITTLAWIITMNNELMKASQSSLTLQNRSFQYDTIDGFNGSMNITTFHEEWPRCAFSVDN